MATSSMTVRATDLYLSQVVGRQPLHLIALGFAILPATVFILISSDGLAAEQLPANLSDNPLRQNIALAFIGATVSAIYLASSLVLGKTILTHLGVTLASAAIVLQTTFGAAILSIVFTALALSGTAHPCVTIAVGFSPLALPLIAKQNRLDDSTLPTVFCGRRLSATLLGLIIAALNDLRYLHWSASISGSAVLANLLLAATVVVLFHNMTDRMVSIVLRENLWPRGGRIKPWTAISWVGDVAAGFFLAQYILYVAILCVTQPTGPDMAIYHLAIPRDTLASHAFHHDSFCYAGGLQYAWHMYGLPVFHLGGERGYQCLSFAAFAGILAIAGSLAKAETENSVSVRLQSNLCVLATAAILVGISRACLSNNDAAGLLSELVLLLLAIRWWKIPDSTLAILLGVMAGWTLAIKLTTIPGVALIYLYYLGTTSWTRQPYAILAGVVMAGIGGVWPLVAYLCTGSPLPQHLLGMRMQGPPLQHLQETLSILNTHYGTWYFANVHRMFDSGNQLISVILLGGIVGAVCSPAFRRNRTIRHLAVFAIGRFVLLGVLQSQAAFHDRYHLISLVVLGIVGAIGWTAAISKAIKMLQPKSSTFTLIGPALVYLSLTILVWQQFTSEWVMKLPYRFKTGSVHNCVWKDAPQQSLWDHRRDLWLEMWKHPGARGPHLEIFDWARSNLPKDAVLAGSSIVPYWSGRKYLQMSPIAQDKIDLSQPPELLRRAMLSAGAEYLHLHFPGTPDGIMSWATPEADEWLKNTRAIAKLSGVKSVACFHRDGKLADAIYDIRIDTEKASVRPKVDHSMIEPRTAISTMQ